MSPSKPSRFSFIIPTYNRCQSLRQCLLTATNQDHPNYEIIVIDDASTDNTREMVQDEFPAVNYLRQEKNRGPATARNRGIQIATGEFIAFTDDDCIVPPNFLSSLAKGYELYPEAAGVGAYVEALDELIEHNMFAQYEAYMTHQVYGAGTEPYLGGLECPAGGTCAMSYKRAVLDAVGGFDESFPAPGGEDTDLKLRVVQGGDQLLYIPLKILHNQPYALRSFWSQYRNHGRGVVHYERKHKGKAPTLIRLLLRAGIRFLRWLPGVFQMGMKISTARLLAELADLTGQWQETGRLHARRTSPASLNIEEQ
ncbi:MAG: glycosyltransferase [Chloroflexota bacterium]